MSEPHGGNGATNNYSIKELLTNFVLPDLREIKEELRSKVSRDEFATLSERVGKIESTVLTSDDVSRILEAQQKAAEEFGISKVGRNVGLLVALCTVITLFLAAHQAGVF